MFKKLYKYIAKVFDVISLNFKDKTQENVGYYFPFVINLRVNRYTTAMHHFHSIKY